MHSDYVLFFYTVLGSCHHCHSNLLHYVYQTWLFNWCGLQWTQTTVEIFQSVGTIRGSSRLNGLRMPGFQFEKEQDPYHPPNTTWEKPFYLKVHGPWWRFMVNLLAEADKYLTPFNTAGLQVHLAHQSAHHFVLAKTLNVSMWTCVNDGSPIHCLKLR